MTSKSMAQRNPKSTAGLPSQPLDYQAVSHQLKFKVDLANSKGGGLSPP